MHATINGGTINFVDTGKTGAMPVVFVHGFPFSQAMWREQVALAGASFRTVAYDVRGHGLSDIGDGQYTIEGHVDDLVGLLDLLRIAQAAVVGLSMGGYITLRALERNPERFRAAVLCDTRSDADSDETKLGRAASIAAIKKDGSAPFAAGFLKRLFAPESFTSKPEAIALVRSIIEHTPPLSLAGTLLALAARTDTTASLDKIRVPVLILTGEKDPITPPSAAEAMHRRIPGSELHLVPGAAHMSNLENPAFFNEKLLAFLTRVSMTR